MQTTEGWCTPGGPPGRDAARRWLRVPASGAALAATCGAVLLVLHARNVLDSDEGVVLNGAWNLFNGRALYTDFFEFLPPGSFYLVLAVWEMFGTSYWVAKGLGLAALAAAAIGVDRIARLLLRERRCHEPVALAAVPLLLCLFSGYLPAINHNTFHLPVAIWSTFFAVRGIQRVSWRDCAAAGFLCGVGFWFLHHRSAAIGGGTLIVLLLLAWRRPDGNWRKCSVACAVAMLAPVMAMTAFWPASVLFEQLVVFPITRYVAVNRTDPTPIIAAASLAIGAAWLLRRHAPDAVRLLLVLLGTLLLTALQRPDLSHVAAGMWPLLCLLPLVAETPATTIAARIWRAWIAAGLAALPLPLVATAAANPGLYLSDWSGHPALQYVRKHCPRAGGLYAGPFAPGLYYETGTLNPTRYSVLLPRFTTDAQFREALQDLTRRRPGCAITNYQMVAKFGHSTDNAVDAHLAAAYDVVFEARGRTVWMARGTAGSAPGTAQ